MTDIQREFHEANRLSWNEATKAHNSHKVDQAGFFRAGGNKLFPEELELLGDVRGKTILHLQCNAGQDTLSMVQMGAVATGVDISDEAIAFAQQLSADSGMAATFVRSDVYDWLEAAEPGRFDIVFSSYGAICWLSDLGVWAEGIAKVLKPGGRFVLVEFHPALMVFETDWSLKYDYFGGEKPLVWEDGIGDYVAESGPTLAPSGWADGVQQFKNPHPSYEFQWPTSEVLTALIRAGLVVEHFREYPYTNGWKGFERMQEREGRRVYPPEGFPSLPMMFSVAARKPG